MFLNQLLVVYRWGLSWVVYVICHLIWPNTLHLHCISSTISPHYSIDSSVLNRWSTLWLLKKKIVFHDPMLSHFLAKAHSLLGPCLMFFPMVQLRLKISYQQSLKSEWSSTQAFSWDSSGRGVCGKPLFGLANFMWWCALNGTWGVFFSLLLYVVSLFAFHCMLTLRTMCTSSVGGRV